MCQHLTVLARTSERRYVAQCEHGTIHMIWERAVLHFHPTDFLTIADFLERWVSAGPDAPTCERFIRLFRTSNGTVQLWISGIGLYLSAVDVIILCDVIQAASRRLTDAAARFPDRLSPCYATEYQELRAVQGACSIN